MRMTEYMDFMNRDKLSSEDRHRYTHIDINNPNLKEARKEYRKKIKAIEKDSGLNKDQF